MNNHAPARAIVHVAEHAAGIDKIIKSVLFFLELPVEIPLITFGHAAANMGNRIYKAAVDQREQARAKACGHGHTVRAISIEQKRGAAVLRRLGAHDEGDRHALPVAGLNQHALTFII